MIKRYLLVEVNIGKGEASLSEDSPTVQDWAAYKRFVQSISRATSRHDWHVKVHAVYDLAPTGVTIHQLL